MNDFELNLAPGIIAVSPAEESESAAGGIIIPDSVSMKDQVGIVLGIGPTDVYPQNPDVIKSTFVKVGEKVVHAVWSNVSLTMKDGRKVRFIRFEDVIGVYK